MSVKGSKSRVTKYKQYRENAALIKRADESISQPSKHRIRYQILKGGIERITYK